MYCNELHIKKSISIPILSEIDSKYNQDNGGIAFDDVRKTIVIYENNKIVRPNSLEDKLDRALPDLYETFKYKAVVNYMKQKSAGNKTSPDNITEYDTSGFTTVTSAYNGGVYSPTQNRIYFVPSRHIAGADSWHYIDCDDGSINAYDTSGFTTVTNAYRGGVYSPTQNRIYFMPFSQTAPANSWHYIDCDDGSINAYDTTGFTTVTSFSYYGGVYSPTQNRIYFVPHDQIAGTDSWHYIDCADGSINAYDTTGFTTVSGSYNGGVYSPTQNRIYFVPFRQTAPANSWHYIDCVDGSINTYDTSGFTTSTTGYAGGVYSPIQNRIYFVSLNQTAPTNSWHYLDCGDGSINAYDTSGFTTVNNAYYGGVYSPTQNRIYFMHFTQTAPANSWHYIDCVDGSINTYDTSGFTTNNGGYFGGVYSPTQNRIYFVPYNQIAGTHSWHYLQCPNDKIISTNLMANTMFNKF
jgi:hypothetical protein